MQVEEADDAPKNRGEDRMAQDEEQFFQELEEDEELRAQVRIFKDEQAINANTYIAGADDDDDDAPEVPIEELLDELTLARRGDGDEEEEDLDDSMQE